MEEEISEDYCFICKDGGLLLVCDYEHCLKAYHPECIDMDPTFLETDNRWICCRHSCHVCSKNSKFKCICCPYSLCPPCTRVVEFVIVKEEIGLCSNCFKLACLVENNIDEDPHAGKIDFTDRETYECLFKEYWEIMKKNECITVEDLQMADVLLKQGNYCHEESASDKIVESNDIMSDGDDTEYNCSSGIKKRKRNSPAKKKADKKIKLKQRRFTSWGSEQLLHFLTSIGRETDNPIPQLDVCDIIYNYIQKKALIHPRKKKKVLCDEKLYALFRRKVVNRFRISDMLDKHFADNQPSEEELFCGLSAKDNAPESDKRRLMSEVKVHKSELKGLKEKDNIHQYSFASITANNIKLVYLRRSLVEQFLQNPDTFEDKVKNSFVRVKPDPNDPNAQNCSFQLMMITGVDRMSENYFTRKIVTDFVLLLSDKRSIRIPMLSDDDFSEEECDNLRRRVNEGIIKRPRMVEFARKASSLHEDITNHWIERELIKLQNLIDRANEKGWRRELFEYVDKRELLETPEERTRLLQEHPEIIADDEMETEAIPSWHEDAEIGSKDIFAQMAEDVSVGACGRPQKRGRREGSEMELPLQTPSLLVEESSGLQKTQEMESPLQAPSLLVDDPSGPKKSQDKLEASWVVLTNVTSVPCEEIDLPLQTASLSGEDTLDPEKSRDKLEGTWSVMTDVTVSYEDIELPLQTPLLLVENPSVHENPQDKLEECCSVMRDVPVSCEGVRASGILQQGESEQNEPVGSKESRDQQHGIIDLDSIDEELEVKRRNVDSTQMIISISDDEDEQSHERHSFGDKHFFVVL